MKLILKRIFETHGWEGVAVGAATGVLMFIAVVLTTALIDRLRGRHRFPPPPSYTLTWPEFEKYSLELCRTGYAIECQWIVYRLDPARAPFPSMLKTGSPPELRAITRLMYPDDAYWRSQTTQWPHPAATFCARIQRTWKNRSNLTTIEEVCISNFQIGPLEGSVPGEPPHLIGEQVRP